MATVVAAPPAPPLGPIPEQKFNLWFVGVFIMTLGTCMQAFGGNLQRLSARREESRNSNPKRRRKVCKQPLAIFGIIMLVGGGVVSSAALAFSAQSILAPLILLIFISNPVFAHYINDEPFKRRTDGVCTLLIMGSVALVISFAPHHSASYNADHLKWLFQQSAFVAFLCIVFSAIFASWYVKRRIFQRLGQDWTKLTELRDLAFVHISYGVLGGTLCALRRRPSADAPPPTSLANAPLATPRETLLSISPTVSPRRGTPHARRRRLSRPNFTRRHARQSLARRLCVPHPSVTAAPVPSQASCTRLHASYPSVRVVPPPPVLLPPQRRYEYHLHQGDLHYHRRYLRGQPLTRRAPQPLTRRAHTHGLTCLDQRTQSTALSAADSGLASLPLSQVGYEKDGVGGGIRELFLNWILYVLGFSYATAPSVPPRHIARGVSHGIARQRLELERARARLALARARRELTTLIVPSGKWCVTVCCACACVVVCAWACARGRGHVCVGVCRRLLLTFFLEVKFTSDGLQVHPTELVTASAPHPSPPKPHP